MGYSNGIEPPCHFNVDPTWEEIFARRERHGQRRQAPASRPNPAYAL
jgi:hypothetical protein